MKIFLVALLAAFSMITVLAQSPPVAANVIESIQFHGLSRVPVDTVKALVRTKPGDVYSDAALRKDFTSLWNTGRFDDIRLKSEKGERGGLIVSFTVTERP